jgi:hypothetical protein
MGFYAAHVVAAGITAAITSSVNLAMLFERMGVQAMHDENPHGVLHPFDTPVVFSARRSYIRELPLRKLVEAAT